MALVSVHQLAADFARTPRYIQTLLKEGMPRAAHGKYDLEICKTWYIRHLQNRIARHQGELDDEGEHGDNFEKQRARLTRLQADKAERELGEMRGELIPLAVYRREQIAMVVQTRQQLLQLPGRAAPQLEGEPRAVIKAKLTQLIHSALKALAADNGDEPKP